VAAFAGLSPREHQSGTLRGRTRLAKTGNSRLRRMLYFPAMSAARCNPILKALYDRLVAAGKPKAVALAAVCASSSSLLTVFSRADRPSMQPINTLDWNHGIYLGRLTTIILAG
ncbi:MAG: IS110 family transposase, partial [Candidatus Baltobacteraceae bacterium]